MKELRTSQHKKNLKEVIVDRNTSIHQSIRVLRWEPHKNNPCYPDLSNNRMFNMSKSDLLGLIAVDSYSPVPTSFHAKIIDGAVIVHSLPNHKVYTFCKYGSSVFLPWLEHKLKKLL